MASTILARAQGGASPHRSGTSSRDRQLRHLQRQHPRNRHPALPTRHQQIRRPGEGFPTTSGARTLTKPSRAQTSSVVCSADISASRTLRPVDVTSLALSGPAMIRSRKSTQTRDVLAGQHAIGSVQGRLPTRARGHHSRSLPRPGPCTAVPRGVPAMPAKLRRVFGPAAYRPRMSRGVERRRRNIVFPVHVLPATRMLWSLRRLSAQPHLRRSAASAQA